ncbi:4-diphosphocytidyl-2-C-methyl-D-erythritol kinase [Hydrogenivirga caldilitoris]|uniref:4-diphosphocytidyl-2-C-methyl-D-erythritol kinase n=1 Tax=Hydrogenivirga caldilitoris TaxID=246264 RepID=A0A497XNS8_9AQUI|nr:4-(cytidine 5'-diphospho)-2-C-methyl-D-erythritol kinase [Hydrogenivirga caldilitoris]RLJ69790.1 4-diphosphocytidyl-2-C-methyl-D-erythritol kinase [Hydrogenivirga caldilitoris]
MEVLAKVSSPAKINLGLWILGKRSDGYHDILTLYHAIDLCDEVRIEEGPFRVETSTGIPMEENLVYRALAEFERRVGREIELSVFINKNIPEGAGLGGGSSNVATVLKEVNRLMGELLGEDELMEIAGIISSDAPFFFRGGTQIGRGRGEILEEIEPIELDVTLLIPSVKASTRKVYSLVREEDLTPQMSPEKLVSLIREGRYELLENKLGEIACSLYPEIGEAVRFVEHLGFKALVSGSGSAVFYIGKPTPELETGARLRGWKVVKAKSWLGV